MPSQESDKLREAVAAHAKALAAPRIAAEPDVDTAEEVAQKERVSRQ